MLLRCPSGFVSEGLYTQASGFSHIVVVLAKLWFGGKVVGGIQSQKLLSFNLGTLSCRDDNVRLSKFADLVSCACAYSDKIATKMVSSTAI